MAPVDGLFEPCVEPGSEVEAGALAGSHLADRRSRARTRRGDLFRRRNGPVLPNHAHGHAR